MLKAEDNPPIIWPEGMSVADFDGRWWVAHTKSRNEKALAHELIAREISYFLPMRWKVTHQRGRKLKSLLPLFGGYLFFVGDEVQKLQVLRTNRVANIIEVADQGRFIGELSKLQMALQSGAAVEPHQYIKKGQRCRVTSGPLMGLDGIVIINKKRSRLILQVDMLGQAASVEIDTDLIEVIEK